MSPYIAFAMGMIVALHHVQSHFDPRNLFRPIIIASVMSLFWSYYLGQFTSQNYSEGDFAFISDVRYEIISPALLLLSAWTMHQFINGKNLIFNAVIIMMIAFVAVISKTRGLLAGYLVLIPFLVLIANNKINAISKLLQVGIIAIVFALVLPQIYLGFDLLEVWEFRLFGNEETTFDVTLYTRLAEYAGQMNLLFGDPISALFGFGIATPIFWDPYITDFIGGLYGVDLFYDSFGVGAHSTYINALFHGGLIAGWIPTFAFGVIAWIAARFVFLKRSEFSKFDDVFKAGLAMIVVTFAPMAFGNMFADRINCLLIGIIGIYIVAEWEKWQYGWGQYSDNIKSLG